ncbi:MAG: trypsin-like peptidase domain-containing protein [Deltaproteobacteria bacterium]|nr:trypsin-like peptidase domain-containing protein [Deltaproteobacteria bacterium]
MRYKTLGAIVCLAVTGSQGCGSEGQPRISRCTQASGEGCGEDLAATPIELAAAAVVRINADVITNFPNITKVGSGILIQDAAGNKQLLTAAHVLESAHADQGQRIEVWFTNDVGAGRPLRWATLAWGAMHPFYNNTPAGYQDSAFDVAFATFDAEHDLPAPVSMHNAAGYPCAAGTAPQACIPPWLIGGGEISIVGFGAHPRFRRTRDVPIKDNVSGLRIVGPSPHAALYLGILPHNPQKSVCPGDSGGPVTNPAGQLIGVMTHKLVGAAEPETGCKNGGYFAHVYQGRGVFDSEWNKPHATAWQVLNF